MHWPLLNIGSSVFYSKTIILPFVALRVSAVCSFSPPFFFLGEMTHPFPISIRVAATWTFPPMFRFFLPFCLCDWNGLLLRTLGRRGPFGTFFFFSRLGLGKGVARSPLRFAEWRCTDPLVGPRVRLYPLANF